MDSAVATVLVVKGFGRRLADQARLKFLQSCQIVLGWRVGLGPRRIECEQVFWLAAIGNDDLALGFDQLFDLGK